MGIFSRFRTTRVESVDVRSTVYPARVKERIEAARPKIWEDHLASIIERAPVGPDVVPWMQQAGTINSLLADFEVGIRAAGGFIRSLADDPYIPGLRIDEYKFEEIKRARVEDRRRARILKDGVAVATVPLYGKEWTSDRNLLGMILSLDTDIQWTALLARYQGRGASPPKVPNTTPIGLPTFVAGDGSPLSLSGLCSYATIRPALRTTFTTDLSLPEESRLKLHLWGSGKDVLASTDELTLGPGDLRLISTFIGAPRTGYLEVEPTFAKKPVTVVAVSSSPIAI